MRCLFVALVIFVSFFNEIDSSELLKITKLSNGSFSQGDKDKINLHATIRRPGKPDKRRPEVTFQPIGDPEESYQLYQKYYAGRNEPPASSGNAALELYNRHFMNGSKDFNYDHYGRLASRVALEDALINFKKPLGKHPDPSDSKSSSMPKKPKLQTGFSTKEDEDRINMYEKYYANRTEPPASSGNAALEMYHRHFTDRSNHLNYDHFDKFSSRVALEEAHVNYKKPLSQQTDSPDSKPSAMRRKSKLKVRSSPEEYQDRINLYEKYYAGRPEPPASSGNAAFELYHQHFTDGSNHVDDDTHGSFAPTVVQEEPRDNFEQPLGQHSDPPDSSRPPSDHLEFPKSPSQNNSSDVGGLESDNLFENYNGQDPNGGSGTGSGAGYHE